MNFIVGEKPLALRVVAVEVSDAVARIHRKKLPLDRAGENGTENRDLSIVAVAIPLFLSRASLSLRRIRR